MSDAVVFIIWSEPVAKGRPRFAKGRTYTPKKTKQYEDRVAEIARREMDMCFALMQKCKLYVDDSLDCY